MTESLRFVRIGRRKSSRLLIGTALFSLIFLTACGGSGNKSSPTALPQPSATIAADAGPPPTPAVAAFGKIEWATAIDPKTLAPAGNVSSFSNDAAVIYAVLAIQGVTPGLTLSANWEYNNIQLEGVGSTVTATQSMASGWIEFHLILAGGQTWPIGTYAISVSQPGADSVRAEVKITRANS